MALPSIMRKLFQNDGYGPLLKDEIVSRHISVQDWSSSYDYPVATLARGGDGLIYCSVAQSGPGTAAGAKDPVLDAAQAFWSSPEVPTRPADDSSNSVATTEWVSLWYANRIVPRSYYIDPVNGDDSNTGTTSDSPFKTLSHCEYIIKNSIFPLPSNININLASGTYNAVLGHSITGTRINFRGPSSGFAIFTGFYTGSPNLVTSLYGRLQFSSLIEVLRGSVLLFGDGLYIQFNNLGSKPYSFYIAQNSTLTAFKDNSSTVSYTGTNTFTISTIDVIYGSHVHFPSSVTFTGSGVTGSRYYIRCGSGISGTGSQTFFPGNSNGSTDSTSYYF